MNQIIIEIMNGVINEIRSNPDQLIIWGYLGISMMIILITNAFLLICWIQAKIERYIDNYKKIKSIKGVIKWSN